MNTKFLYLEGGERGETRIHHYEDWSGEAVIGIGATDDGDTRVWTLPGWVVKAILDAGRESFPDTETGTTKKS